MTERRASLVEHEAAYLRAALLLGLVREGDVSAWAQLRLAQLDASQRSAASLTDLLLADEALSPMREALRPLAEGVDPVRVTASVLAGLAVDDALAPRSVADRLRVLGLLRREFALSSEVVADINAFIERAMLADARIGPSRAPDAAELEEWMDVVSPPAFFRFEFGAHDEAGSFLAAVSRKLVRDRTALVDEGVGGAAWVAVDDGRVTVLLNRRSWRLAVREFAPLPMVSRIPALSLPADAVLVLDEQTGDALGSDEAAALLLRVMTPTERAAGSGR